MRLFRSLYSRLAAVLIALFLLLALAGVSATVLVTDLYQQEVQQKLNRTLAEHIVAEKALLRDKLVNQAALEEVFHMMMVINPAIELYLLDATGQVLAYSAPPDRVIRHSIDLDPVRRVLANDESLPIRGDDPRSVDREKVFSVAPIVTGQHLEGYLYIILGSEQYDGVAHKLANSYILSASAWTISGAVVLALVVGLALFAWLTRRLARLARTMEHFKAGEVPKLDADKAAGDEIDRLARSFRFIAAELNAQITRVQKTDNLRRELVANVSHDLRTPLSTLQGYVETLLLKDEKLDARERREYLNTAIAQCKRLTALVTELFDLAKLDAQDVPLHRETFSLRELVQDTVQKFQLAARDKDIHIAVHSQPELPYVNADIGMIERVFHNLLENALRYTPPTGKIDVLLVPQERDVAVQVSDTGCGIPAEDLPRVFERFFQADKSRNTNPGSSGLGLAIAKRILELHGSDIEVHSSVNNGTSFAFRLAGC